MPKQAISVTLERDNLTWLRGRVRATGRGSLSEVLDQLVTEARNGRGLAGASGPTVVGTIRISEDDPDLSGADSAVRDLFGLGPSDPSRTRRPRAQRLSRGAQGG